MCFPEWNAWFLAWVCLAPLLVLLPGLSFKDAGLWSLAAGFAANLGTLYWVYPTCRAAQVNVFVSGLALVSLSAYMALYWGAFGLLVRLFQGVPDMARPLLAAAAWAALEWGRSHWFTGFPWLLLASSQWNRPALLAPAEVGGAYLVSFFIVLANACLALLARDFREKHWDKGRRLAPALILLTLFFVSARQLDRRPLQAAGPALSVAVAQGNIDQYKKWDQTYEEDIRRAYEALTHEAAAGGAKLIVWPETSVPGWVPNEPQYLGWLQGLARDAGVPLLAGAASHQGTSDYNAAFLFSPDGQLLGQYRKRHLVPFGEFVPLPKVFARWIQVLNELGDFAGSQDWTVFEMPGFPFSANICFESLFPDIVSGFVQRGAQATVNMTNDGWYLDTAAPRQHFIASVLRAVETRTWVVRAANTGISGFIDPRGRVSAESRLLERTVLWGTPRPMAEETFYVRHGDLFARACGAFVLLGVGFTLWPRNLRWRRIFFSVPSLFSRKSK